MYFCLKLHFVGKISQKQWWQKHRWVRHGFHPPVNAAACCKLNRSTGDSLDLHWLKEGTQNIGHLQIRLLSTSPWKHVAWYQESGRRMACFSFVCFISTYGLSDFNLANKKTVVKFLALVMLFFNGCPGAFNRHNLKIAHPKRSSWRRTSSRSLCRSWAVKGSTKILSQPRAAGGFPPFRPKRKSCLT